MFLAHTELDLPMLLDTCSQQRRVEQDKLLQTDEQRHHCSNNRRGILRQAPLVQVQNRLYPVCIRYNVSGRKHDNEGYKCLRDKVLGIVLLRSNNLVCKISDYKILRYPNVPPKVD